MLPIELPGGVVAGVVGTDTPLALHSFGGYWLLIPMTLEALVGGVGNVCARSMPGLPAPGWGAIACGGAPAGFIGLLMEWWWCRGGA